MAFSQVSTKLFACGLKDRSPIRTDQDNAGGRSLANRASGGVSDLGSFNVEGALLVFR